MLWLVIAFVCLLGLAAPAGVAAPAGPTRDPAGVKGYAVHEWGVFTIQPEKPNGTAIVICPGGGYGGLVTGAEGHGIAKWLGAHGVSRRAPTSSSSFNPLSPWAR